MAGKKEGKSRGGRGGKAKKEALLSRDGAEGAAPTRASPATWTNPSLREGDFRLSR